MSYIFLRHGKKKFSNGKGIPKFDPPIVDLLPNKHLKGVRPSAIISSPMLRCRQTAKLNFPYDIIVINNLFVEYLGNQKEYTEFDFDTDTFEYIKDFKFESNTKDLYSRLGKAIKSLPVPENGGTIVVFTHGLCLEYLSRIFKKEDIHVHFFEDSPKNGFRIDIK